MKKIQIYLIALVAVAIAGCNGLGKMAKNASTVKYEVTPNPLELKGDSVAITIKGNYPPKYFAKKVTLNITPTLKTPSGEKAFKPVSFQGEKLKGDATTIKSSEG